MTNFEIFTKVKDSRSYNYDIKIEFENDADYFVKQEIDQECFRAQEEEIDDEYEVICSKYDWSLPNTENYDDPRFKSVVVNVDFDDNNLKYEKESSLKEECCEVTDYILIDDDNIDSSGANIDFKETTIIQHNNKVDYNEKLNFDASNHTSYGKVADITEYNVIPKKITFQCVHCSLKYNDIQILAEHMKAIHGNIKISYQKKFINVIDNLNIDKGSEKKNEEVLRSESEIDIIDKEKLKLVPIKIRSCKVCKKLFTCKPSSVNCGSVLFCKNCLFGSEDSEDDKESCVGKRHKCSICSKVFWKYKRWHSHITDVHSGGHFICDYCGHKFKCKRYIRNHLRRTHFDQNIIKNKGKAQDEVKCPECPNIYNNKISLKLHIKNCHGQPSQCALCSAKFKSQPYLNTHMYRVHCADGSQHVCHLCGKKFRSTRRVRIHIKNSHPFYKLGKKFNLNRKTEECHKCKGFYSRSYIKKHLESCSDILVSMKERDSNVDVC